MGTDIVGSPDKLAGIVKISFRYIFTGSVCFSLTPNAGEGVVGVSIASTDSKTFIKSLYMSLLICCAFT